MFSPLLAQGLERSAKRTATVDICSCGVALPQNFIDIMLLAVKQGEPRSVRPVRRHGESRREPGAFADDTEPQTAVSDGR